MTITTALPIQERITQELYDRLRFLTAGYDPLTPVSEVLHLARFEEWTPKHWQIVLTHDGAERNPELSCPGNPPAIAWNVLYNIRCHLLPSEDDDTPISQYQASIAATVQKVVCDESLITTGLPWHTMGNLAINAEWQNHEPIDSDGGISGINVPLLVTYRTDEDNPFNKR